MFTSLKFPCSFCIFSGSTEDWRSLAGSDISDQFKLKIEDRWLIGQLLALWMVEDRRRSVLFLIIRWLQIAGVQFQKNVTFADHWLSVPFLISRGWWALAVRTPEDRWLTVCWLSECEICWLFSIGHKMTKTRLDCNESVTLNTLYTVQCTETFRQLLHGPW